MSYDIGRFESRKFAEAGVDFQIVHPVSGPVVDEAGEKITIKLGGADSPRIKAAVRDRRKQREKAYKEAEEAGVEPPVYDRDKDMVDDLVTLTMGWSDSITLDGKPFPFSPENAEILYTRFPEIAEQMTTKASHRINFMLASSTKSPSTPTMN